MSIHDLLDLFDAKDVQVQFVDQSLVSVDATKHGAKITLATSAITPGQVVAQTHPVGILVWISRELWKEALATKSSGHPQPPA